MFIIDFFKRLFGLNKKEENNANNKIETIEGNTIPNIEKEDILVSSVNLNKEEISNKNDDNSNILVNSVSHSPEYNDEHNNYWENSTEEKESDSISTEAIQNFVDNPVDEEKEENLEEYEEIPDDPYSYYLDPIFSADLIVGIKNILRPIVRSYNYEKKDTYAACTTSIKTLKCFITVAQDSELLIFRPTQSDTYNNSIAIFVRGFIYNDFKSALIKNKFTGLLLDCYGGKIFIRKKI
jgi:hypothetical protein